MPGRRLLLWLFLVPGAGEDWEARILWEPRVSDGEFTEKENRAARRLDGAGMRAGSAEAGGRGIGFSFSGVCHKSTAPRGSTGSELRPSSNDSPEARTPEQPAAQQAPAW